MICTFSPALTSKDRARAAYDLVTNSVRSQAGVEANLGKTECWGLQRGLPPPGINDLAPLVVTEQGDLARSPVWKSELAEHLPSGL